MIYVFLTAQSVVLITVGYIYTCCYLEDRKLSEADLSISSSINRVMYLLSAIIVSVAFILILVNYYKQSLINASRLMCLVQMMFPIAAIDLKRQKIPNKLLLVLLVLRIIIFGVEILLYKDVTKSLLIDYLTGMLCVGGFFLIMLVVFKNSIGMGDVKLFAILGLYQGLWGSINSVCFSLAIAFIISVILLAAKRKNRKDVISFGHSILAGTIIAICLSGM